MREQRAHSSAAWGAAGTGVFPVGLLGGWLDECAGMVTFPEFYGMPARPGCVLPGSG